MKASALIEILSEFDGELEVEIALDLYRYDILDIEEDDGRILIEASA